MLVKCAECSGQVSNKATECPHCGFPLELQPPPSAMEPPEPLPEPDVSTRKVTLSDRFAALSTVRKIAVMIGVLVVFAVGLELWQAMELGTP